MDFRHGLVTGGAGFLGSHLVDRLREEGMEVTVLDDLSTGRVENLSHHNGRKGFRLVLGDVRDGALVKGLLQDADIVFHLAAVISVEESVRNPRRVNSVNVDGTLTLLESCLDGGVEKFVFASSCGVYGDQTRQPVSEDAFIRPKSPYAASKVAAEAYIHSFHENFGMDCIILRFFNIYGVRQIPGVYGGVITNFFNHLRKGRPPIIYGDGEQTRDFMFVEDAVDSLITTASRVRECSGETFNVGSGIEISINRLLEFIGGLMGVEGIKPVYKKEREGEVRKIYASIGKIQKYLGFSPRIELKEGLRRMIDAPALTSS